MKVTIEAHEISDAKISKISLVKHGAIRAPFKIVKREQPDNGGVSTVYPLGDPRDGPPPPPRAGGAYAESMPNPQHSEPHRYVSDRHGAQAAQVPDPLNVRKSHTFDSMFEDARNRKRGGGW